MKNLITINNNLPLVAIDKRMDKLADKIMFPKKLEKANNMLLTTQLPKNKHLI
jgi:hypothetical protein